MPHWFTFPTKSIVARTCIQRKNSHWMYIWSSKRPGQMTHQNYFPSRQRHAVLLELSLYSPPEQASLRLDSEDLVVSIVTELHLVARAWLTAARHLRMLWIWEIRSISALAFYEVQTIETGHPKCCDGFLCVSTSIKSLTPLEGRWHDGKGDSRQESLSGLFRMLRQL